jgi:hypothetical protein
MTRVVIEERVEAAERFRSRKRARGAASAQADAYDAVTVRLAVEDDEAPVRRLAERDGRTMPQAPLLLAEVDGAPLAALSLLDGRTVADPFHHTAHLVELLALRSAHLRGNADTPPPRRRFAGARALARRMARSYS